MVEVLYVGSAAGTSADRANALRRLGHKVTHIVPSTGLPRMWPHWLNRFGGPGIDSLVAESLRKRLDAARFDIALVDSGDVVGPKALAAIRSVAAAVGNYCPDNPYVDPPPEGMRWTLHRRAARYYDLLITPRRPRASIDVRSKTGMDPLQVWFCADEVVHHPRHLTPAELQKWSSEVVFVGTWMPGRGKFLVDLIEQGVPVTIYGPRWHKAPERSILLPHLRADYLRGAEYSLAIQGAKVALVMLNGANADEHTTRSAEIPAIGTAMCAPRTAHHLELYREDVEAVFFDDARECAAACMRLLADDDLRERLAEAGRRRTFQNRTYNEPLMDSIVKALTLQANKGGLSNAR